MAKKKPELDPESCKQCRFFKLQSARDDAGYCRAHPSAFVHFDEDQDMALFSQPVMAPDEWCGEFVRVLNS